MTSSRVSWVRWGGWWSEAMRRDWWSRVRASRGWEGGVRPADVRMGRRLVVSWRDFVGSRLRGYLVHSADEKK